MEKKVSRIISPSEAMAEYPEIMLTTFDHRLLPHLSLVVINGWPRGYGSQGTRAKKTAFSQATSKI